MSAKERCSECEAQNGVPCPWHRQMERWRVLSPSTKGTPFADVTPRPPDFFRRPNGVDYQPDLQGPAQWPAPGRTVESASHEPEEEFVEAPPKPFRPKRKKRKKVKPKKNKED